MRKIVLTLISVLFVAVAAFAQNRQVSGTVTDPEGKPITGVSVLVKGTSVGMTTDANGQFSLSAPANGTLVLSFVGMEPQEIDIAGRSVVNVQMQPDVQSIDDVIVVAYGTARKGTYTGSATSVSSKELATRKVANVTKALDGLAPGLQSTSGSGQPGSGTSIIIRGFGSLNASNSPLYVVDGVPYSGQISAINPDDIESISVLKDAASAALYGARGGNGVILISTKKGSRDGMTVGFKASVGVSSRALPNYETMKSKEWIEALYSAYYNQALANGVPAPEAGQTALGNMSFGPTRIFGLNEMYNPYDVRVSQLIDTNTGLVNPNAKLLWQDDWMDEVTNNSALRQEYIMNVTGGSAKSQYMFSLGYLNEEGVLATTKLERYTGRMSIEAQPKEWFNAGMGLNISQNASNSLGATGSTTSNVFYSAMLMGTIYPVYMRNPSDGSFILDDQGNKQFDYGETRPSGQQTNFNSIATLYDDKYQAKNENLSARTHVDLLAPQSSWAKGLKGQINFGADYYNNRAMLYYNPYFGNAAPPMNGRLRKTDNYSLSYTVNELLTYNKTICYDHNIDVLAGHEYYELNASSLQGEKTGFPFGGLYELSTASTLVGADSGSSVYRVESYLARLNYDFKNRYYLSGSWRTDASSRFHPDHMWGTFWSVGANWRISQEKFLKNVSWINNLALKASYGAQGNDGLSSYYAWQGLYSLEWTNSSESGAMITSVSNPDVSWEKNLNFNTGVEAKLFDNRLSVSAEYYRRKTEDMLLSYPLPQSSGFSGYNRNSGNMLNTGFEFAVTGQIVRNQNWDWALTVMGTTIKNEVLKLTDDGAPIVGSTTIIKEGYPVNSFFVAQGAGVDPATGDQLYWANRDVKDGSGNVIGSEKYITSDYTVAQQENNRMIVGSRIPDIYGSITNQVRWKNLDLVVSCNYSVGGKILDGVYLNLMSFYYAAQAKHVDLARAWKQPGDMTDIPRFDIGENQIVTDDQLLDASYFSLKNISLGYTLPGKLVKGAGLKDVRFSVTADNVALFTHLKGMDPQYNFTGGTSYVYAPTRTISLNLDLKF